MEKALTAILVERGATEKEMRRVGHRLSDALGRCDFPPEDRDVIQRVCAAQFDMGVRYGEVAVDAVTAVGLVHAATVALRIVATRLP